MSISDIIFLIWILFEGINDFGFFAVDIKLRGLLLLIVFVVRLLEALGVLSFRLPARRVE